MNNDTIMLLRECNSGCKNATNSMEQVIGLLHDDNLKNVIKDFNQRHIQLGDECHNLLNSYGCDEKDPPAVSKIMSFISTEFKMMTDHNTQKAAEIMMDGCNMGIKSISSSINRYSGANAESKALAESVVKLEQDLINALRVFL